MKILIGTNNRAKTKAVHDISSLYYPDAEFENKEVASLVSAQPMSDEETRQGAINRATQLLISKEATFGIGLEGGVNEIAGIMYICNWGALATKDGKIFTATGAGIPLPEEIATQLKAGAELGPIMDVYTNKNGIRHDEGAIGVFTNGLVNRSDMFGHIMLLLIGQYELAKKLL
jgi:inosine/xanthosine triphosphatase